MSVGSLDPASDQPVNDLQIVGNLAYLVANDLVIVDVSTPAQPRKVGAWRTATPAQAVQVADQWAYVTISGYQSESGSVDALMVIDVSDPAKARLTGTCRTASAALAVHVVGQHAYVVASSVNHHDSPPSQLQIFDIANPAQPTLLGQCPVSEGAQAVQVVGAYAYVAGGSWSADDLEWRDGLMVVDVSAPAHPKRVGGMSTPSWAADLQVVGDRVYLADGPAGLMAVSLPIVPTLGLELTRGVSGLELRAQGAPGISCQLLRASTLPGPWLPAEPVTLTNASQLLRTLVPAESSQFYRLQRK